MREATMPHTFLLWNCCAWRNTYDSISLSCTCELCDEEHSHAGNMNSVHMYVHTPTLYWKFINSVLCVKETQWRYVLAIQNADEQVHRYVSKLQSKLEINQHDMLYIQHNFLDTTVDQKCCFHEVHWMTRNWYFGLGMYYELKHMSDVQYVTYSVILSRSLSLTRSYLRHFLSWKYKLHGRAPHFYRPQSHPPSGLSSEQTFNNDY